MAESCRAGLVHHHASIATARSSASRSTETTSGSTGKDSARSARCPTSRAACTYLGTPKRGDLDFGDAVAPSHFKRFDMHVERPLAPAEGTRGRKLSRAS